MTAVDAPTAVETVESAAAAAAREPADRRRRFRVTDLIGPFLVFVAFMAFWEYMHRDGMRRIFDKPGILVPSPVTVIDQAFLDPVVRRQLVEGLGWTLQAMLIGFTLSIVLGTLIAVAMARAEWIERSFYPYLVALQAVPVLAVVPLIGSVFGGGMGSRIFVCVMISIFPIVTNTLFGLTSVEPSQHDLFSLQRASAFTRLVKLQFPAAMPSIFTGYRISAGLSVIGVVVGEQFFREGAKPGLGVMVEQFRQKARFPQVYAGLIVIAALGIAVFLLFGWLSKRVVGHWYEATRRRS